ncbi:MAG: isoaspartyl peptidase/L-asparaginase [Planctomycetota bacterium]
MSERPALVVHGGAWDIPSDWLEPHRDGCRIALEAGLSILDGGGTALDACQEAVRILEDDPTFDAGRGAFLNREGDVELDAALMRGDTLDIGAVAAVRGIANPIRIARKVLEDGHHIFLAGEGARQFAREVGVPVCAPAELVVPRELERWKQAVADGDFVPASAFGKKPKGGTVGAVARDSRGRLAVAISTGGSPFKRVGRVGDSPLPGCGFYADDELGAACCTGLGEAIAKVVLARQCVERLKELTPAESLTAALENLQRRVSGLAGVILMNRDGEIAVDFNTPEMAFAYCDAEGRTAFGPSVDRRS